MTIYLQDYEQQMLLPLPVPGRALPRAEQVADTAAGRALITTASSKRLMSSPGAPFGCGSRCSAGRIRKESCPPLSTEPSPNQRA